MSNKTIPYVSGSINPVQGCVRYSRGCQNCYAWNWATRFRGGDFSIKYFPEKLDIIRRKKSGLWFVGSMTDLFQKDVDLAFVDRIVYAMAQSSASFLILTKRATRMSVFFSGLDVPSNVGIGVTAEGQAEWDERVPILQSIKAGMRWVSVEPMLEGIYPRSRDMDGLSFVACGPETGAKQRECHPSWMIGMSGECLRAGVPFFDKRDPSHKYFICREFAEGWKP